MYLPEHFHAPDTESLYALVAQSPFGILVTTSPEGLEANHLPFELDRRQGVHGSIFCHVARSNPVWQSAAAQKTCLAIFQGPSTYISPSLYASKQETHKVVPTYNYAVVHVHGQLIVHDDIRTVRGLVSRLTQHFEAHRDIPWKMGDAPGTFIDERLTQIVGLEIRITRLEGKWKMSQNRSPIDQASVILGLQNGSDNEQAVATFMSNLPHPK